MAAHWGPGLAGGLIGALGTGSVYRPYSTGVVSGANNVGGPVGGSGSTLADSCWDTQTSGQAERFDGVGRTTAQMQQRATYQHYNFHTLWVIDEGSD